MKFIQFIGIFIAFAFFGHLMFYFMDGRDVTPLFHFYPEFFESEKETMGFYLDMLSKHSLSTCIIFAWYRHWVIISCVLALISLISTNEKNTTNS